MSSSGNTSRSTSPKPGLPPPTKLAPPLIPPLNPYSPQEISNFAKLDLALRSHPELAREGATLLNPKALARLIQGIKFFQDTHLGRAPTSRYGPANHGEGEGKKKWKWPLMKLPDEFLRMRDPKGPLFYLFVSAYRYKKEASWRQFDFQSKNRYGDNISLLKKIQKDLIAEGVLKRPVVFFDGTVPSEYLVEYKAIVKKFGGRIVKDIAGTGDNAPTHVVAWDGEEHDSQENLDAEAQAEELNIAENKVYLRTLAVVDPKAKSKKSGGIIETTMQDSKKKGGKVKTGKGGVGTVVFEHPMAFVHWWYHPPSYDEWMPAADVAGPDTDVPPRPPGGPWIVGCKFVRDVARYNEWGAEADYAISDYEKKVKSYDLLEKKLIADAKAREAAKPLKIRLTLSSAKADKAKKAAAAAAAAEKEKEAEAAKAASEKKRQLSHPGMMPRQIFTGFYSDSNKRLKKTVYDGCLKIPKGSTDLVRSAIKEIDATAFDGIEETFKLPNVNDMLMPSLDPALSSNMLITELRAGNPGTTLVTTRRINIVPTAVTVQPERIRGGGEDVEMEDVSKSVPPTPQATVAANPSGMGSSQNAVQANAGNPVLAAAMTAPSAQTTALGTDIAQAVQPVVPGQTSAVSATTAPPQPPTNTAVLAASTPAATIATGNVIQERAVAASGASVTNSQPQPSATKGALGGPLPKVAVPVVALANVAVPDAAAPTGPQTAAPVMLQQTAPVVPVSAQPVAKATDQIPAQASVITQAAPANEAAIPPVPQVVAQNPLQLQVPAVTITNAVSQTSSQSNVQAPGSDATMKSNAPQKSAPQSVFHTPLQTKAPGATVIINASHETTIQSPAPIVEATASQGLPAQATTEAVTNASKQLPVSTTAPNLQSSNPAVPVLAPLAMASSGASQKIVATDTTPVLTQVRSEASTLPAAQAPVPSKPLSSNPSNMATAATTAPTPATTTVTTPASKPVVNAISNVAVAKTLPGQPTADEPKKALTGDQKPTIKLPAWYDEKVASDIERTVLPEWFNDSAIHRTENTYILARERIIDVARRSSSKYLTSTAVRRCVAGDAGSIMRLHQFLVTWGFINGGAIGDSAPLHVTKNDPPKLLTSSCDDKWTTQMTNALGIAVTKFSTKRKLESDTVEQLEVDWDSIAKEVGKGVTTAECFQKFLATDFEKTDQNNVEVVDLSPTTEDSFREDLIADLVDGVKPKVAQAVVDAALAATDGDTSTAQKAGVLGMIASKAVERAREDEAATSRILQEILDLRMAKLENRLSLLDDLELMLDAERMALELERRDLYTNRCRHWFNADE